ncbi:UPF0755 protein [Nocardiopsis mwathae]|uniref:Endolytic murein transglycosylase n=1 Tax=Nocardiopsis mwathae TaxID=1472723 RepID=A0A7X0D4A0_9ACTN|nr:endolytic transglycosylase MltG [Nocardiopsis mwathae]MBB6171062.1 UPF0755 protein [Nocardiopsis mwathae]
MSDNDTYGDPRRQGHGPVDPAYGDPRPYRARRARLDREFPEDPLSGPRPDTTGAYRPASDPLTDPWRREPPRRPAPGGYDTSGHRFPASGPAGWDETAPPPDPDLDRPRGRRHRPTPDTGYAPPDADPLSAPRRASDPGEPPAPGGRRRVAGPPAETGDRAEAWAQRAPRGDDTRGGDPLGDDRPRGRRRRPAADSGAEHTGAQRALRDAAGPRDDREAAADAGAPGPRRRRARGDDPGRPGGHAAVPSDESWLDQVRSDAGDDDLEPVAPRVLDFDSVPVRRKGGRGRKADGAPARERRGRPRSRGRDAEEPAGAPDPDEQERPRRARRAASGAADAAESPDLYDEADAEDRDGDRAEATDGDEGRGHRRGRRGRAGRDRRGTGGDDGSGGRRGGGKKKIALMAAASVFVVLAAGGAWGARTYVFPPDYNGEGGGEVEIVIAQGEHGGQVAQSLADAGVVASPRAFLNALTDDQANRLSPGTYRLRSEMSAQSAVALLLDPSARVGERITFKEGLRGQEILGLLADKTDLSREDLDAAFADTAALGLPSYAEEGTEGYLFPDTYTVSPGDTASEVLKRMVDRFKTVSESPEVDLEERAREVGHTPNEIMAIASIIQAETGTIEDMPKISRVVYNRLDEDMELGMDSTCFYVIGQHGIALTNKQLAECKDEDSDYATYGRKGLPAGPFVAPGEDAIQAALNPADGDWLFFVATDPENGVTEFADTYAEFERLKQKFNESQRND